MQEVRQQKGAAMTKQEEAATALTDREAALLSLQARLGERESTLKVAERYLQYCEAKLRAAEDTNAALKQQASTQIFISHQQ